MNWRQWVNSDTQKSKRVTWWNEYLNLVVAIYTRTALYHIVSSSTVSTYSMHHLQHCIIMIFQDESNFNQYIYIQKRGSMYIYRREEGGKSSSCNASNKRTQHWLYCRFITAWQLLFFPTHLGTLKADDFENYLNVITEWLDRYKICKAVVIIELLTDNSLAFRIGSSLDWLHILWSAFKRGIKREYIYTWGKQRLRHAYWQ